MLQIQQCPDSKPANRYQSLFEHQNVTSLEAHVGLVFTGPRFSAAFSPYRVQYLSEVHNPNFPVVAVHAAVERSFSFSSGFTLEELSGQLSDFSVGTRLRLLERTYVHGTFSLFQALTDNPRDLLPVQIQKGIFVDPTVAWAKKDLKWSPRVSLGVKNLGHLFPQTSLYPERPDFGFGFGLEPPLEVGQLKLGLDVVDLIHGPEGGGALSRFRVGSTYHLGIMDMMLGWNKSAVSAGVQFGIQVVQVGIVYEFLRSELNENTTENRIATEFSVRL